MLAKWGAELIRRLGSGGGGGGSADPYFNSVVSLLELSSNLNDQRTRTWTAQGNAAISGGKLVLDGTGDGLLTPAHGHFTWGTNDFTLEGFVRFSSTSGTQYLFGAGDNFGAGNLYVAWNSSVGKIRVVMNNAGTIRDQNWSPSAGVDYHIAIVRKAGYLYHFVNGVKLGTEIADTTTIAANATQFGIGIGNDGSAGVSGSMWGVRFTNGVGRYNANFTVPSLPYPTNNGYTDANWSNVKFLFVPTGAQGASPIAADLKSIGITWAGNSQIDQADTYPAVKFDGTGDYGTSAANANLVIGASTPFTLEVWAKVVDSTGGGTLTGSPLTYASSGGWAYCANHGSGHHAFGASVPSSGGFPTVNESSDRGDNTYHAFCVERDASNIFRIYLDGVVKGTSGALSGAVTGTVVNPQISIGNELTGYSTEMKGSIYGMRLTVGTARYGGAYTPITPDQIPSS